MALRHPRSRPLRIALGATLASILAAFAFVGSAGAVPLPPGWTHVEVNVLIHGQPHTLIYDRGAVTAATPTSLTLKERDGTVLTIDVAPNAIVKVNGRFRTFGDILATLPTMNYTATTVRTDGNPATRVTVNGKPKPKPHPRRRQSGRGGQGSGSQGSGNQPRLRAAA